MKQKLNKKDLGAAIKTFRIAVGMTQLTLSNKLKTTQSIVSQVENGIAKPSIKMINRISKALDVPQKSIFSMAIGNKNDAEIIETIFQFYN